MLPAHKSLCQVWFRRVYRARGLMWPASVVLHDSLPYLNLVQRKQESYLLGVLYLVTLAPAFVIAVFIALVEINSSTLISAWLPCYWVEVEIKCRVTRQLND